MRTLSTRSASRQEALRRLVRGTAPKVSVYLHAAPPEDPEAQQLALRWQALRQSLLERGADAADVTRIDEAVSGFPLGDRVLAAFASEGELVLSAELDRAAESDSAVVASWARIVPLLRWEQGQLPVMVAVVGHRQADLRVYEYGRQVAGEELLGPDDEIERNAPGGWAQSRYRRRAEDSWAHNAVAYAKRLSTLAETFAARLVIVTGDPREVQLVLDRLPAEVRRLVTTEARPKPGFNGTVRVTPEDAQALVEQSTRAERARALTDFDDAGGRGLAVEGVDDVQAALDRGAVQRLLVVCGAADDPTANALACQALDSDAQVLVVEPDEIALMGGVGAVLRF